MSAAFQLYRKAIAALIGGLIPLIVSLLPGAEALADPITVNVLSIILATAFAAVTADKIDGASVVALARVVIDALDGIGRDPAAPPGATPGVAGTIIGRKDGVAAVISATPVDPAEVAAGAPVVLPVTQGGVK